MQCFHSRPVFRALASTFRVQTRGTAVRRLPRTKDPLTTSPDAKVTQLEPGVTFIQRPPPSLPSPHSLSSAPSSPLLHTPSTSSLEQRLPPPAFSKPIRPKESHITPEQLEQIRSLRKQNPQKWTAGKLAKRFDCSPAFVMIEAELPKRIRKVLEAKDSEKRESWGPRKQLQRLIRQKRREFW